MTNSIQQFKDIISALVKWRNSFNPNTCLHRAEYFW